MALARATCVALLGVDGYLVEVEADLSNGLPGLALIGMPDASLYEARDRVRAAVLNSGQPWPNQRMTVGLFPAALPKSGTGFDVAVAAAVLAAQGQIPAAALSGRVLLGELALDGRLRPLPGVLPAVIAAADGGFSRVVVPAANAVEASLVPGVVTEAVESLRELIGLLRGELELPDRSCSSRRVSSIDRASHLDLADVAGQADGRLAMEVAAAGGHHVLLQGPPGAGKTMLAERLPGLLPPLDERDALEVTSVYSVAGVLPPGAALVRRPPFRSPHHTTSMAALVGGGSRVIRPGAVSLAHRGVLFLDEAPEFSPRALDALRQPLESGVVEVSRAAGIARFPARFTMVLAANPCPCGHATTRTHMMCTCPPAARQRYLHRMSGPLLDRVDVRLPVHRVSRAELRDDLVHVEPTAQVAERVRYARESARVRLSGTPWRRNADVPGPELRRCWPLPARVVREADRAFEAGQLTARGVDRVVRMAWTLADLGGRPAPGEAHVATALRLRLPVQP